MLAAVELTSEKGRTHGCGYARTRRSERLHRRGCTQIVQTQASGIRGRGSEERRRRSDAARGRVRRLDRVTAGGREAPALQSHACVEGALERVQCTERRALPPATLRGGGAGARAAPEGGGAVAG